MISILIDVTDSGPLLDGSNSTCITIAESSTSRYRKLLEFGDCIPPLEELPITILGSHLMCDGRDGLEIYVNTAANPGTDMCSIGQELRECSLTEDDNPTGNACKFLCPCPVHDGGCTVGFLQWNLEHLPANQPSGQICEVVIGLGP